jgi:hypothetical protein
VGARRPSPRSRALASAWIEVLESRRALKALKKLKPQPGDVISHELRPEDTGEVVSISDDGRINIPALGAAGSPPITLKSKRVPTNREFGPRIFAEEPRTDALFAHAPQTHRRRR